jgi:hypothetical protein
MPKVGLVSGVTPHERDVDIVKALGAAKRKLGGSADAVIAIKNEADKIYRYAVINGIHQEMHFADRLEDLGLLDETAQGARRPKGVWTVFGRGRDMSLQGILAVLKGQSQ